MSWGDKELGRLETDLIDYSADIRSGLQTYDDIDTAIMMGAPGLAMLDSPLPGPADAAALAVVGTSKVIKAGVKGIIKYGDEVADGVKTVGKAGDEAFESLGVTGRSSPKNLKEKLAMEEVYTNPKGRYLNNIKMNDSRFKSSDGWQKFEQKVNGVNIHYVKNQKTGKFDDFKYKDN
jgi:hypothetical protein